jgi:TPR repeat protein
MVGRIYTRDRGVPVNVQSSILWYERAVAQGAYQAANNLGIIYRFGQGVPVDMAKTASHFRLAAEGGMANGCYVLGVHLEQGQGIAKDLCDALHWYEQAETARDKSSLNQETRRDLGVRLELARLRLKSDEGDPRAMMSLADWYSGGGSHLGKNVNEATRLLVAAAEVGHAPAQVVAGESLMVWRRGRQGRQEGPCLLRGSCQRRISSGHGVDGAAQQWPHGLPAQRQGGHRPEPCAGDGGVGRRLRERPPRIEARPGRSQTVAGA